MARRTDEEREEDELMRELADMYWRVKREPTEGTAACAIRCHAQAAGLVSFVFDVHPDTVACAVACREKGDADHNGIVEEWDE